MAGPKGPLARVEQCGGGRTVVATSRALSERQRRRVERRAHRRREGAERVVVAPRPAGRPSVRQLSWRRRRWRPSGVRWGERALGCARLSRPRFGWRRRLRCRRAGALSARQMMSGGMVPRRLSRGLGCGGRFSGLRRGDARRLRLQVEALHLRRTHEHAAAQRRTRSEEAARRDCLIVPIVGAGTRRVATQLLTHLVRHLAQLRLRGRPEALRQGDCGARRACREGEALKQRTQAVQVAGRVDREAPQLERGEEGVVAGGLPRWRQLVGEDLPTGKPMGWHCARGPPAPALADGVVS